MKASFGRKQRGNSYGKKSSKLIKGVKGLGMALVAGAGIYAATHSTDKEHTNHEAEQSREQQLDQQREKLAAEGAKPAPTPEIGKFGQSGGAGKIDKVEDVLNIAGAAVDAARDVDEATGKFGKTKAAVKGAKAVRDEAKEVGKRSQAAKFEENLLTDKQAKKFAKKQMKTAEKDARKRHCDNKYPAGEGNKKQRAKMKGKRELCYKTGS
jgi:hypothetical protein